MAVGESDSVLVKYGKVLTPSEMAAKPVYRLVTFDELEKVRPGLLLLFRDRD